MSTNALASEQVALLATIDPDVTTASTVTSDWVSVAEYYNFAAIVMAGTLGSSATVDAKLEQATDSSGTGAKDISGKAITQMTQAGTDQSDTQAVINAKPDELDIANDFTHFRLSVTVGTATSDLGAFVVGVNPRNAPASDTDLASVGEIVS
jgi:hypothetical protein